MLKNFNFAKTIKATIVFVFVLTIFPEISYAADWYNTSYAYRRKITFDNSAQAENLTSFPAMLSLTNAELSWSGKVLSNLNDVVFVDDDDATLLDWEWEEKDKSGESTAWVEVPQIDGNSNTDFIYMYYGHSSALDQSDAEGTWDSNFVMVQHLQESPSDDVKGHIDSTSNDNDGTPRNFSGGTGSTNATGKINGADRFDGEDSYVEINDADTLDLTNNLTMEIWAEKTSLARKETLLDKGTYSFNVDTDNTPFIELTDGTEAIVDTGHVSGTNAVRGMEEYNGNLYACGTEQRTRRYDGGTTWTDISGILSGGGIMYVLKTFDDKLFVGEQYSKIHYYNGATWTDASGGDLSGAITSMEEYDDNLYAGSSDDEVYRYDGGTTWTDVSGVLTGGIASMAVFDGKLYVGAGTNVYSYDGAAWTNEGAIADSLIRSLTVYNNELYGGTDKDAVAKVYKYVSTGNWTYVGTLRELGLSNRVDELFVYNGNLYGSTYYGIDRLFRYGGGTTWTEMSGASITDCIYTGTVFEGKLYVGCGDSGTYSIGDGFSLYTNSTISTDFVYLTATYNGATGEIFLNGASENIKAQAFSIGTNALGLMMGGTYDLNNFSYFYGTEDEVRISNSVRSDDWIAAGYLSMSGFFDTIGLEENCPSNGNGDTPKTPTTPPPEDSGHLLYWYEDEPDFEAIAKISKATKLEIILDNVKNKESALKTDEVVEIYDQRPTFKGKTIASATVEVFVSSEAIAYGITHSDENSNWQWQIPEGSELEFGDHQVWIKVTDANGNSYITDKYPFKIIEEIIPRAEASEGESLAVTVKSNFYYYLFTFLLFTVIFVLVFMYLRGYKHGKREV